MYICIYIHMCSPAAPKTTPTDKPKALACTHTSLVTYIWYVHVKYIYIYKYSYIHIYILTYVLTSSTKDNTNGQTQGTSLHTHAWWRVMNRVLKGSHYCHEKKRPATWFIHMSDVTRLYVWAKSWNIVIMVTQKKSMWHEHVIHMDNMTHSRVTWLIYMCHEPILEMQPLWSQKKERRVIWLTHMRAVLIHMCVMDRLEALTWVSYSFIWMT